MADAPIALETFEAFIAAFNGEVDRLRTQVRRRTILARWRRAPAVLRAHYRCMRGAGVSRTSALMVSLRLTVAILMAV